MARVKISDAAVGQIAQAKVTLDEFCRNLSVKREGQELNKFVAREQDRYKKNGLDHTGVETRPHYGTTFRSVEPMKQGAEPTEAEQALAAKVYKTKEGVLSIDIKKLSCPKFYVKNEDGKTLREIKLDGKSLQGGQTATGVWKVYKTANSHGAQLGFEGLIFDEEPTLWTPGPQSFGGYTVEGTAEAPATEEAPAAAAEEATAEAPTKQAAFSWNN